MPRAPKQCGHRGCDERVPGGTTYCEEHAALHFVRSPSSRAADRSPERRRRVEAVRAWVAVNGWVCPGYMRDPHPTNDLTAAHSVAVSKGGTNSLLTVLCRMCNSRQGTNPS